MLQFGSDKPDLRNPLRIMEVTEFFQRCTFKPFLKRTVRAIRVHADMSKGFHEKLLKFATSIGMGGLGYLEVMEDKSYKGPIDKFIPDDMKQEFAELTGLEVGDTIFFIADKEERANLFAGQLRNELGKRLDLIEKNAFRFCFVNDFPMYEYNKDENTRARVSYNAHPDTSDGTPPDTVFTDPASPLSDGVSKTILPARLPSFPDYRWPAFLQGIIDCGNSPAQRDILLLGAATVLGSTLNKLVSFVYGRKHKYPCLQVFVTAPPASGKGALTWVRRLAEPIHNALLDTYREKIKTYRMEKTKWDTLGKEKANTPEPEQPQLKMLLIAGDNTGTGIQENLMDSGGVGLICETEADTVSTAIGGDHGHWSDLLRKCFDHDRLAYNRRTNHEYRECNVTFLCVLLSGTPAQIKPLIPSAENGLFSRQLFYYMPAIEEWEDQFNEADTDYDSRFLEWGAQWKEVLDAITASVSNINMKLTHEQKEIFNFHFARVFGRASAIHGNQMKSAVTRIAINIFRIISIIALLRSLESLLPGGERSGEPQENIVRTLLNCPGLTPSAHIPQENIADGIVPQFNLSIRTDDFYAVLALVEPLYRHACHILSLLPAGTPTAPSANMTPETLFDCLPLRFTRNEAIDKGEQVGVPAGSVDSLLKRMTERGQLVKVGRGEYEFNARMHTRTCVGVRESASSASLQDS